jgi:hypothetical protein
MSADNGAGPARAKEVGRSANGGEWWVTGSQR